MNKKNLLISACLMGVNCRYDGNSVTVEQLDELMKQYHLIPICPEIMGGLPIPRNPAERIQNKVITSSGEDVTECYVRGAKEALRLARLYGCSHAILKERSPSCGYGNIYDGTFSHKLIQGNGMLAELLVANDITVFGETGIEEFMKL